MPGEVTWIWDEQHSLYYSPESGTYAYPDPTTGQWNYMPASSLASSSTGTGGTVGAVAKTVEVGKGEGKEDGEIEDDVGWGGLMDPEELDRALKAKPLNDKGRPSNVSGSTSSSTMEREKHPAYGNPHTQSRPMSPTPPPETPNHLLRLSVLTSPCLTEGHVAIIDAREGGIQLGRDRCEKGGHPKIRIKEMEVSKVHAVVYWGTGGEGEEGWWVVDLGSTHGTFVAEPDTFGKSSNRGHRLSTPKTSSLPYPLSHLSTLTLGQTTFQIHLHPSWPCDECQLGRNNEIPIDTGEPTITTIEQNSSQSLIGYAMNSSEKRENKEVKRKREMAALKDSLLNRSTTSTATPADESDKRQYIDRSAIRRRLHPKPPPRSANPIASVPQPSQASDQKPVPEPVSTFAQNLLAAQGWAPGTGLGKDKNGRSEAIEVKMRVEKRGLGAKGADVPVEEKGEAGGDWRKNGRTRRFDEVREW